MANYPTGIFSPSVKNTGDVIQVTHVTDLEAEVTAIETGLKTGLQHSLTISTGGLSVSTGNTVLGQNLSVAGNSTMSGLHLSSNLQVDGASTFTGAVTFNGAVTFAGSVSLPTMPRCVLTHSATTPLAAAGGAVLNWDTEVVATTGMHSTTTNSSRITFAPSTGWWRVGWSVPLSVDSNDRMRVTLRLNDTTGLAQDVRSKTDSTSAHVSVAEALVRAQSTSDYVTLGVHQIFGATNSVAFASTVAVLRFSAVFVSL